MGRIFLPHSSLSRSASKCPALCAVSVEPSLCSDLQEISTHLHFIEIYLVRRSPPPNFPNTANSDSRSSLDSPSIASVVEVPVFFVCLSAFVRLSCTAQRKVSSPALVSTFIAPIAEIPLQTTATRLTLKDQPIQPDFYRQIPS
ncbi:hypothetical protein Taro_033734 [Colocasia esculenta]|uniref:Uncharacterized protein n=1 Tax=Colocasia esculenta TaxID=4460 RepID=A0A843VYQ5_COLES|nr:hypothetical protein [Colocasia esculenta]